MTLDHPIRRALSVAALYLLAALALDELRLHEVLSAETVQRLMGVLMGTVVIASANLIPKRLVPLARVSCDPAREQMLRRFCGRVLVLGGLGYTLAYMLAPIDVAATLAMCLLAPAAVAVAGVSARCAWNRRGAR